MGKAARRVRGSRHPCGTRSQGDGHRESAQARSAILLGQRAFVGNDPDIFEIHDTITR